MPISGGASCSPARSPEAILLHEQAIRLSPRDPNIVIWCHRIGEAHLVQSRIDEAIFWLERGRRANPVYRGQSCLARRRLRA